MRFCINVFGGSMGALDNLVKSRINTFTGNIDDEYTHYIKASSTKFKFYFKFKFKFSRIAGNSGIGKTYAYSVILEALRGTRGYKAESDLNIKLLTGIEETDSLLIDSSKGGDVFVFDEYCDWILGNNFKSKLLVKDVYFVYISRNRASNISYDYRSLYFVYKDKISGIVKNMTYIDDVLYNKYNSYTNFNSIVTEDEKSGYQFNEIISSKNVISAGGKDNIRRYNNGCLCIVDGSAFGSCIEECLDEFDTSVLYLINSFEWLLLKSNVIDDVDCVLNKFNELCYPGFHSYEDMCTKKFIEYTQNTGIEYSKSKLPAKLKETGKLIRIVNNLDERIVKNYVKDIFL